VKQTTQIAVSLTGSALAFAAMAYGAGRLLEPDDTSFGTTAMYLLLGAILGMLYWIPLWLGLRPTRTSFSSRATGHAYRWFTSDRSVAGDALACDGPSCLERLAHDRAASWGATDGDRVWTDGRGHSFSESEFSDVEWDELYDNLPGDRRRAARGG
jgi:hypothetical protein